MESKRKTTQLDSAIAVFLLITCFFLFFAILDSGLSAFAKFMLSVATLAACGYGVARAFNLECWYGMFLLRSQSGLSLLDRLAKNHPRLWPALVELGTVIGFGSFAYFLLPKKGYTFRRIAFTYGLGTFLMVMLSMVVAPLATGALFSMLSGGAEFAGAGEQLQASATQFALSKHLFFALLVLGGLSLMTTAGLIIYSLVVLVSIAGVLLAGTRPLSSVSPGGTPIIPGINLPLLEGIAALAVVLMVHEAMHGIVARIHKFPLRSAGLVFFGFLPFGAFVDIDEKKMFKGDKKAQNAVFVAGTMGNFLTAMAFVALFIAFFYSTEPMRVNGVFVESGAIPRGAIISSIGGEPIHVIMGSNLSANTSYIVSTSKGEFTLVSDENAKLDIGMVYADSTGETGVLRYADGFGFMAAIFRFLALTFALNFVVGAINLVPIPLFDGYYLMKNGVGNERIAALISYAVAAAFAINMLPWIFR
jgi:membrane-associated protease RseP (regulator of RpoE activity)